MELFHLFDFRVHSFDRNTEERLRCCIPCTVPETNIVPLKWMVFKTTFLLGMSSCEALC